MVINRLFCFLYAEETIVFIPNHLTTKILLKMKFNKISLSLFLLCLLINIGLFAQKESASLSPQIHNCGTNAPTEAEIRYTLDVVDPMAATVDRNAGTTCLGIAAWIIRNSDGSAGLPISDINTAIAYANFHYLEAGIEFYICSVNYIDNTDWYDLHSNEETAMAAGNQSTDGINVYFANSVTTNNGAACGYARYPFDSATGNRIIMDNDCTATGNSNGTFVHELGHYFNLFHTHNSTTNGNTAAGTEYVPRSGANSNCGTAGDLLCDTEADPNGSNDGSCNFVNDGNSTQDIHGNTYSPDLDNIMSYYSDGCGGIFTPEQYTRIMGGLATRLTHTAYDMDNCAAPAVADPSGLTATLNNSYGVDLNWTDNSGNETGFLIERSSDGGTTFQPLEFGAVAADLATYTDNTTSSNTTYEYRVKASNDDCNAYSNTASITVGLVYCTPTHQSNSCTTSSIGVAIHNFTFGGALIDNPANGCNGPLSVFTPTFCAPVTAGQTYAFTANFQLNTPPSGSYFPQFVTVWIDVNQDGDFGDAGEMVYQATAVGGATVSQNIVIPATSITGKTTMRIRTASEGTGMVTDPCTYMAFSETEDYGLDIIGGLPVELISFNGRKDGEAVALEWLTASEENNDYFLIERSTDGDKFEPLQEVVGLGTSEKVAEYFAYDTKPNRGINYYRLAQFDLDGTRNETGKIVAVEFTDDVAISVSPNPVSNDFINLNYTTINKGSVQIEIIDVQGRLVTTQVMNVSRGETAINIDLPELSTGVYVLRTLQDGNSKMLRFVKR